MSQLFYLEPLNTKSLFLKIYIKLINITPCTDKVLYFVARVRDQEH